MLGNRAMLGDTTVIYFMGLPVVFFQNSFNITLNNENLITIRNNTFKRRLITLNYRDPKPPRSGRPQGFPRAKILAIDQKI